MLRYFESSIKYLKPGEKVERASNAIDDDLSKEEDGLENKENDTGDWNKYVEDGQCDVV